MSSTMSEEEENVELIFNAYMKNVELFNLGWVNPMFKGLPDPLPDPTHPFAKGKEIAARITNKVPVSEAKGTPPLQSKSEVKQVTVAVAANIGIIIDPAHLEDLYILSVSNDGPLSQRDIWFYLRGAMRTQQVSLTTGMTKLISSLEGLLTKHQQVMASSYDAEKQLSERLTLISQKVEAIAPTVCHIIQTEHAATRAIIVQKQSTSIDAPNLGSSSSIRDTPTMPGKAVIIAMCTTVNCPPQTAESIASKYEGKITWDDHNLVMSGTLGEEEVIKCIASLENRA